MLTSAMITWLYMSAAKNGLCFAGECLSQLYPHQYAYGLKSLRSAWPLPASLGRTSFPSDMAAQI